MRKLIAFVAVLALSGCAMSITEPTAMRLSSGDVLSGTAVATRSSVEFTVASPDLSTACKGGYGNETPLDYVTATITCDDGRKGTIVVERTSDRAAAKGFVKLSDGSTGKIGFARLASPAADDSLSVSTEIPASIYVPPSTASGEDGCTSSGIFGSISCITGGARTNLVSGYTRANGTYVHSYYRSR